MSLWSKIKGLFGFKEKEAVKVEPKYQTYCDAELEMQAPIGSGRATVAKAYQKKVQATSKSAPSRSSYTPTVTHTNNDDWISTPVAIASMISTDDSCSSSSSYWGDSSSSSCSSSYDSYSSCDSSSYSSFD